MIAWHLIVGGSRTSTGLIQDFGRDRGQPKWPAFFRNRVRSRRLPTAKVQTARNPLPMRYRGEPTIRFLTSPSVKRSGTLGRRMIGTAGDARLKMNSVLPSRKWAELSGGDLTYRKDRPPEIRFNKRAKMRAILAATAALSLIADCAFGQTTRTNPSASSTSKTIPSSSSTSPNSPCSSTNPTSPCYSANAPRNPCYSAAAPNEPCSTTTTPNSQTSTSPPAPTTPQATVHAFTKDQAMSQIEAKGYSNVSGLRKDAEGIWRGKAEKDGLPVNVTLDVKGNVTAN